MVPKEIFFTRGIGRHLRQLQSFELALRDAGIAICNLVYVSSIFPPNCKIVPVKRGVSKLRPGEVTYCVMARSDSNEPSRRCCAGIGLALPGSGEEYGYISEYHGHGINKRQVSDLVEDMAASMLASTLGVEFDPEKAYDERKEIYRMSGKIIKTRAEVQVAEVKDDGQWTTAITAAVFVPER